MKLATIVEELNRFSPDVTIKGSAALDADIGSFEKTFGVALPYDYKSFIKVYNGFSLMGTAVYGIGNSDHDLKANYLFEHHEVEHKMPGYLVPFSPDGYGNHYCFDIRSINNESCSIVFWQHDYEYSEWDSPEVTNVSFIDWVKEVMIGWTLEDYNYDGTEK